MWINTLPSGWKLLFSSDSENSRVKVFVIVCLCSNPTDTFNVMTVLACVLINVISLLLLLFQACIGNIRIVMWIYMEAKIWVWRKRFSDVVSWKDPSWAEVQGVSVIFLSVWQLLQKFFITYKPAYARNFRVCSFTAGQLTLLKWTF